VRLDVAGPRAKRPRDALLCRVVAAKALAPHLEQLVARALEQALVRLDLGMEMTWTSA
jgi:hypothetical protein